MIGRIEVWSYFAIILKGRVTLSVPYTTNVTWCESTGDRQ